MPNQASLDLDLLALTLDAHQVEEHAGTYRPEPIDSQRRDRAGGHRFALLVDQTSA